MLRRILLAFAAAVLAPIVVVAILSVLNVAASLAPMHLFVVAALAAVGVVVWDAKKGSRSRDAR